MTIAPIRASARTSPEFRNARDIYANSRPRSSRELWLSRRHARRAIRLHRAERDSDRGDLIHSSRILPRSLFRALARRDVSRSRIFPRPGALARRSPFVHGRRAAKSALCPRRLRQSVTRGPLNSTANRGPIQGEPNTRGHGSFRRLLSSIISPGPRSTVEGRKSARSLLFFHINSARRPRARLRRHPSFFLRLPPPPASISRLFRTLPASRYLRYVF